MNSLTFSAELFHRFMNNLLFSECGFSVLSAPCHWTTLHLATKGGLNGKGLFNSSRAQDRHPAWSRRGNAQGGEVVWRVDFLTISKLTYFIKRCLIYFKEHLHRTKGCEALKNTYVSLVWLIDFGNQNYPHLGKRVTDGTSKPYSQIKLGVAQLKEIRFMSIKLMPFLAMKVGWLWINHVFSYGTGVSFDQIGFTYIYMIKWSCCFLQTELFRVPLRAAQLSAP